MPRMTLTARIYVNKPLFQKRVQHSRESSQEQILRYSKAEDAEKKKDFKSFSETAEPNLQNQGPMASAPTVNLKGQSKFYSVFKDREPEFRAKAFCPVYSVVNFQKSQNEAEHGTNRFKCLHCFRLRCSGCDFLFRNRSGTIELIAKIAKICTTHLINACSGVATRAGLLLHLECAADSIIACSARPAVSFHLKPFSSRTVTRA